MEALNQLLAINPNYTLIGLMVLFYSLELFLPVEYKFQQKRQHQLHNMVLGLIFVVVSFFWATVAVSSIDWFNKNQVGFFYVVSVPAWLQLILSVRMEGN